MLELNPATGPAIQAQDFGDFLLLRLADGMASSISTIGRVIFESKLDFVDEVIVTEVEICLAVNESFSRERLRELELLDFSSAETAETVTHELPIHFADDFPDWDRIRSHTDLERNTYIERLLQCDFQVAMAGFLPGFVYLSGLPKELQVPRKENPANRTLPNTFAVGGKYAGVYSLPSAAGWNCIGQIAKQILDPDRVPPLLLGQGDSVRLIRCDLSEFESQCRENKTGSQQLACDSPRGDRGTLRFEKPGMLTLIQDRGRFGFAYYAIPRGGAFDAKSADVANAIVGNSEDSAVIECHFVAPTIHFDSDATICLAGADMQWRVDGQAVRRNQTIQISAGSTLSGSKAISGCRGYIAIHGTIETSQSFGSSSCYLPGKFGGNEGRPFSVGDVLQWTRPTNATFPIRVDVLSSESDDSIPLQPGPEFGWLDEASKQRLLSGEFSIDVNSDRMGARLNGPKLNARQPQLPDSVPLLPGMIQLTPSGQCIVVLQDGQTTGGYPRVGYLNPMAISRLNQTPIGHPFCFEMTDSD
ncbi:carboxyltransferase domain-containing protein [Mariniblastus fucicola]|uniref:KipI antagonist n=1 Tax=Mariniblastus fucicola TaxID=980251 RepID=A0A5B9P8A8_9BACT|nr:carboxyltransferase domain-containing protein [Mariniblastus fucicola]QEG22584.1 KipI antagonist [Mariniblastus fucicola]